MMPGETGLEVLPEAARGASPETVGRHDVGQRDDRDRGAGDQGAARYDFIEKPLSGDKLLITVQNALAFARLRSENAAAARPRAGRLRDDRQGRRDEARSSTRSRKTAPTTGRVLITGENGTGKELVARAIHEHSKRADGPFVKLNCAAIPSELIESELFGHEKGAFTGATQQRRGKFELADGGTLFLDEIGDMNPSAQAKVLRVLQENELERVGGAETIKVDVRVVAATNKDLQAEIAAGRFREDLYYRLDVVPIELPPLRERREDIPALVEHFLEQVCADNGRRTQAGRAGGDDAAHAARLAGQRARAARTSSSGSRSSPATPSVITEADVGDALPRREGGEGRVRARHAVQGSGRRRRARDHPRGARRQRPPRLQHRARAPARAQPPLQEDARARHRSPRRRRSLNDAGADVAHIERVASTCRRARQPAACHCS